MFGISYRYHEDELVREICIGSTVYISRMWIPDDFDKVSPKNDWDYLYLRGQKIRYPRVQKSFNVIDLFSGAGGLSYGVNHGLKSLGIESNHTYAVDLDDSALSIHQRNMHTYNILNENVRSFVSYDFEYEKLDAYQYIPKIMGALTEAVGVTNVLLAGPPCQGFSNLNNYTRRTDDRNLLYLAVPAIAIALDVPIVIIENVREIKSDPRKIVENAHNVLQKYGYKVTEFMANGPKLGLAQTRNRHFQIAVKTSNNDIHAIIKNVYEAMSVLEPRTVDWAIKDLILQEGKTPFDSPAELSDENKQRILGMTERNLQEIPQDLRPKSHRDSVNLSYKSVYGRLWADRPAGTITTGFYTPGRGRFIHPHLNRALTAHEAARLQGFPDTFEFTHADGSQPTRATYSKTIGDAVPPVFGMTAILAALAAMGAD